MAQQHDERLADRAWTTTDRERPLRHAVEVRHETYRDPAFLRLHGDQELYVSGYSDAALDRWAELVHQWRTGESTPDRVPRDVYVYFDNDAKVHAPYNAMDLAGRLDSLAS